MRKKLALIISGFLMATPALAEDKYTHCFEDSSTEICKAFLAGLETTKLDDIATPNQVSVAKDSLLGRALEQRAGGRYKTTLIAKKG
ncbi:hypothetical protein [Enterovibrio paralichthyis]|uniref:hypothetical protein n=1 Tax=Enterovibrio paralichthyis TaxID=2853805 RepID=UPI001C4517DC|nr:hypothetical protein [Enterovibrio paralichthyis]MBV7300662.1 hypothetical protein [Enterovibrio paralichthyis]